MQGFLGKSGSILGYSLLGIVIFLNIFSGIVSGIWLLLLGKWPVLLLGIIYSVIMPFVYSIAALPSMLLMPLLLKFTESGNRVMVAIFGFINVVYSDLLILFWTYFVFSEFVSEASGTAAIPLILWGYSTVVAPLGYMARGEQDSIGTSLGIYLAQVSYIALVILWLMGATDDTTRFILGGLVLIFSVFPTWLTISIMKQGSKGNDEGGLSTGQLETRVSEAQIEDEQRFCVNCGKEISLQAEYCRFCGFKK